MFEIDVFTRVPGNKPFDVTTIQVHDKQQVANVMTNQYQELSKLHKNSRMDTRGNLVIFKTNRGNVYAEIEVNEVR